ncbi:chaplin family protein, partial [Streptomyces sp. NPDC059352]|uniref:chaplin family protein n=1 Tax=Streptomyces sp. NPDC059352 TaxID=3346810 RepID=UPI0036BD7185
MRSIISRKVLTAAAATGILSLTGGFALAANSHAGTGDSPGPGAAGQVQAPLPADVCGESMELGGFVAAAVGDLCAQAGEPDGYGDEPGEPTHPPTSPPHTEPPTSPPHTEPPTSPPHTEPPTSPPHTEPPTSP